MLGSIFAFDPSQLPRQSSAVEFVRSDIERRHPGTIDAKYDSQIGFNYRAVNRVRGFRRERADLMRAERGMEWIVFEHLPRAPD